HRLQELPGQTRREATIADDEGAAVACGRARGGLDVVELGGGRDSRPRERERRVETEPPDRQRRHGPAGDARGEPHPGRAGNQNRRAPESDRDNPVFGDPSRGCRPERKACDNQYGEDSGGGPLFPGRGGTGPESREYGGGGHGGHEIRRELARRDRKEDED